MRACDAANELAMPAESADGPQQGDFLKWYRREKAIEQYKKDNPQDPLQAAISRIDGPLKTIAVLTAGYYAVPFVQGVIQATQTGDVIGSVGEAISKG